MTVLFSRLVDVELSYITDTFFGINNGMSHRFVKSVDKSVGKVSAILFGLKLFDAEIFPGLQNIIILTCQITSFVLWFDSNTGIQIPNTGELTCCQLTRWQQFSA